MRKLHPVPPTRPLHRKPLGDALEAVAATQTVLPDFVPPSLSGRPAEVTLMKEALQQLPAHQAVLPTSISVQNSFENLNVMGYNRTALGEVVMNRSGWGMHDPTNFRGNVLHEIGHSVDMQGGLAGSIPGLHPSNSAPFGQDPFVSDYAATQPAEDFAESFRVFHQNPDQLRQLNPEKYSALQDLEKPNFWHQWGDHPALRETGRFISQQISEFPWLRSGLEVFRQASILLTLTGSVRELTEGLKHDRPLQALAGGLGCAAGLGLALTYQAPLLGLAAVALLGARQELNRQPDQEANLSVQAGVAAAGAGAGALVGATVAPLGLTELGYTLAGPIGGSLGLVVGGLAGTYLGSRWGGELGRGLAANSKDSTEAELRTAQAA